MAATADWIARARAVHAGLGSLGEDAVVWRGGDEIAPRHFTMAYPNYPFEVDALWPLLREVGVSADPARYRDWEAGRRGELPRSAKDFAACALDDVAMYFLFLMQAERFSDGFCAHELETGALVNAVGRLVELSSELPFLAERSVWAMPREMDA